ncbi:MAG: pilus assembly protein PilM [Actinomycetota bacterium]|nr:pilus assembly protein PilM [Actinomycetota bacterium]
MFGRSPDEDEPRADPPPASWRRAQTIGVTISGSQLRAVEARVGPGGPRLGRIASVPTPDDAVVDGAIADPDLLGAGLRALWRAGRFRNRRAVIGIGGEHLVLREATFPELDDDELRNALRIELIDLIHYPIDEAVIRWMPIGEGAGLGDAPVQVLACATHRDDIDAIEAAARAARLNLVAIEPTFVGISRVGRSTDVADAVADIGAESTHVTVRRGGRPAFARTFSSGLEGGSFAEVLETELAAIDRFRRLDQVQEPPSTSHPAVDGIASTLRYLGNRPGAAPLRRLLLTGDRADEAIADAVARATDLPVEPVHADWLDPQRCPPAFHAAVGLALGPGDGVSSPVDLRTDETLRSADRRARVVIGLLGLTIGAVPAVIDGNARWADTAELETQRRTAEATVGALEESVRSFDDLNALRADVVARRNRAERVLDGDVAWTVAIGQLAEAMPARSELRTLELRRTATVGSDTGDPSVLVTGAASGAAADPATAGRWLRDVTGTPVVTSGWMTQIREEAEADGVLFAAEIEIGNAARSGRGPGGDRPTAGDTPR